MQTLHTFVSLGLVLNLGVVWTSFLKWELDALDLFLLAAKVGFEFIGHAAQCIICLSALIKFLNSLKETDCCIQLLLFIGTERFRMCSVMRHAVFLCSLRKEMLTQFSSWDLTGHPMPDSLKNKFCSTASVLNNELILTFTGSSDQLWNIPNERETGSSGCGRNER